MALPDCTKTWVRLQRRLFEGYVWQMLERWKVTHLRNDLYWSWPEFRNGLFNGLFGGLIFGLVFGLIGMLLSGLIFSLMFGLLNALMGDLISGLLGGLILGLKIGLNLGLIGVPFLGLFLGLFCGLHRGWGLDTTDEKSRFIKESIISDENTKWPWQTEKAFSSEND